jgi:hypothetical protein
MGKLLIIVGIVCIAVGLFITYGPKIPFLGKLPGDISVEKENFKFLLSFNDEHYRQCSCFSIDLLIQSI